MSTEPMDTFTPAERSAVMSRVRSKDTKPEMAVRSLIHAMGFRYALHRRDLPGNPDLVFCSRKRVIFVHGCFWHGHCCRSGRNRPSSNQSYWIPKLERNHARDAANRRRLKHLGWEVLVIWECQVKKEAWLQKRVARFLEA
jgi:DNA mismatch endonuclease (patch repair protein)